MDNWNNEQRPDMSGEGQFSGNPYQDQNQNSYQEQNQNHIQNQNQNIYNQPSNGAGAYNNQQGGNAGYGQNQNNYANGYGQPYANYNQPPFGAPNYKPADMEEPVGVGEWTGLLAIATFIPCIGLILMLVWAFGGSDKRSKSNFCKAYLIITLIKLAVYILLFIIWGASAASMIDNF